MIPVYNIEDLTIAKVDELIERGVVFDVTSKASVLSKNRGNNERDAFWSGGNKCAEDIQSTSSE